MLDRKVVIERGLRLFEMPFYADAEDVGGVFKEIFLIIPESVMIILRIFCLKFIPEKNPGMGRIAEFAAAGGAEHIDAEGRVLRHMAFNTRAILAPCIGGIGCVEANSARGHRQT